jgi:hypothetical protein
MEIRKSTRHAKIAGDFGEALVLYWLSKFGFECALVDHTGIDIIARHPDRDEVMGISVKSRTRVPGTESTVLSIGVGNLTRADAACAAFKCKPYFAMVVDARDLIQVFVVSKERLLKSRKDGGGVYWKMSDRLRAEYEVDKDVMRFELRTSTLRWWGAS